MKFIIFVCFLIGLMGLSVQGNCYKGDYEINEQCIRSPYETQCHLTCVNYRKERNGYCGKNGGCCCTPANRKRY